MGIRQAPPVSKNHRRGKDSGSVQAGGNLRGIWGVQGWGIAQGASQKGKPRPRNRAELEAVMYFRVLDYDTGGILVYEAKTSPYF